MYPPQGVSIFFFKRYVPAFQCRQVRIADHLCIFGRQDLVGSFPDPFCKGIVFIAFSIGIQEARIGILQEGHDGQGFQEVKIRITLFGRGLPDTFFSGRKRRVSGDSRQDGRQQFFPLFSPDKIHGAEYHAFDGCLFSYRIGKENRRQVRCHIPDQLQGPQTVPTGKVIIDNNAVIGMGLETGDQGFPIGNYGRYNCDFRTGYIGKILR